MHWTYCQREDDSDLQQGDFLVPNEELLKLLEEVHPYFNDQKYIGFVVTTQTCDLVRRGGKPPKAQYISIAVVRSLEEVTTKLLEHVIKPVEKGIFLKSQRLVAKDFLHRLFNQNEQALGLFYYHADGDIGLGDPSVAFLRLVLTLKSDNYQTLLKARKGGLTANYQAKFGWLVGNLYSRAASPDWSDQEGNEKILNKLIKRFSDNKISSNEIVWVEDELISAGLEHGIEFKEKPFHELLSELEEHRPKPLIERLNTEVSQTIRTVVERICNAKSAEILKLFQTAESIVLMSCHESLNKVNNGSNLNSAYSELENMIRHALYELFISTANISCIDDSNIKTINNRLNNNGKIKKLLKKSVDTDSD